MKTIIIVLIIVYFVLLFSIKAIQYLRRGQNEKKESQRLKMIIKESKDRDKISSCK